jgi:hypothetical protein
MAWRASLSICRRTVRAASIQRCGCPLPSGSAPPLVCGQFAPSACEPELECWAKNPGTARGRRRDWSALFASTRIWRAFGSPRASAKPTKPVGSVAQPRIQCPPIRTAVPTPSWGSPECKARAAMESAIREAVTAEAAAVKAAGMKAAAAVKPAAARAHRGGGTSRADDRDCQSRRGQHTEN